MLDDIMSAAEAEERWQLPPGAIRQAAFQGKLDPYIDVGLAKKSGRVWLVHKQVMVELFGPEPEKSVNSR